MRAKVTEQGVTIPRSMLEGADEVDIRQGEGCVVVEPVSRYSIWNLGKEPLPDGLADGSVNHDRYLYEHGPHGPDE